VIPPVHLLPVLHPALQDISKDVSSGLDKAGDPHWWRALLDVPLKVVVILLGAVLIRYVAHRSIDRIAEGIATGRAGLSHPDDRAPTATASTAALVSARREQRARTTASVLKSATTSTVVLVTVLTVLQLMEAPIGGLLASAGVLGVALGFGAQTVVKDWIAGVFLLVEDQFGVGDVVDLGELTGSVESVGMRVTRLRDVDGTVWYVRNGEILRVGNRSQGWARAVLDVGLPPGVDLTAAQRALLDAAALVSEEPGLERAVIGVPQVWGIESVSADGVALRLVVKTQPLQQWTVVRELRRLILDRFDAAGLPRPTGLEVPAKAGGPS